MTTVTSGIDKLFPTATKPVSSVKAQVNDGGIDPATSSVTGGSAGSTTTSKQDELGKDDFLLLLTTQMRYQDPMSPMDNTQFVAQMAQFRALESSNNIEKAITNLGTSFKDTVEAQKNSANSMNNATSVSLIGKEVRIKETQVKWGMKPGATVPINVTLGNKSEADVQLLDSDGKVVKTLRASGKDDQNSVSLVWDGTTDKGDFAAAGAYKINIVGQDKDDSLYAFVQDVVQGVRFSKDGSMLKIGGKELSAADIMDVAMNESQDGFGSISASSAVELLGKNVRVAQNMVSYHQTDGEQIPVKVNAPRNTTVRIAIVDSKGNIVDASQATANESGVAAFSWNGQAYDGSFVKAGTYQVVIDGEENNPSLYSFIEGKVDGVSNLGGLVELKVGGQNVRLSDVVNIAPDAETVSESAS
jgi:flagellar basal-body rod modification protein FlgD